MRNLVFLFAFLFQTNNSYSKEVAPLTLITFKKDRSTHIYKLTKKKKEPLFDLSFKINQQKAKIISVTKGEAAFIKNEATKIIWKQLAYIPKNKEKCTPYVTIKTDLDTATVCEENKKATGLAYGFLNSLNHLFR
jgi:hypothetical protein